MQLTTILSAAALLFGTVFAVPQTLERRHYSEAPVPVINAADVTETDDWVTFTDDAYSTIYGTDVTTETATADGPAITAVVGGPTHRHHHHHHIDLAATPTGCPAEVTSYITVTASVLNTAFAFSSQYTNSSTLSNCTSTSLSSTDTATSLADGIVTSTSARNVASSSSEAVSSIISSILIAESSAVFSVMPSTSSRRRRPHHSHYHSQNIISSITTLSPTTSTFPPTEVPTPPSGSSSSVFTYTTSSNSSTTSFTVSPIIIATGSGTDLHPTTSIAVTTTVTGTPPVATANPEALHCGLHGLPVGDYFLAAFVQERNDVAITLNMCYNFCTGIYGIDFGCESYEFYPEEGTGAPRCDLFGGSVAQSLARINRYVPNVWYDLGCGRPIPI